MSVSAPRFVALRLRIVKWILPGGYAVWTWGQPYTVEGLDAEVFSKDLPA